MSYTLIQTVTLTSNQASISFNSIPATFDDLVLVYSIRSANRNDCGVRFNGSTANFSNRFLQGNGSSASSGTGYGNFLGVMVSSSWTASTFGSGQLYIPNYAGNTAKSWSVDAVSENNATESYQLIIAGLWNQTAAITSLEVYQQQGDNLATGTSASLYGIKRGSSGGVVVS